MMRGSIKRDSRSYRYDVVSTRDHELNVTGGQELKSDHGSIESVESEVAKLNQFDTAAIQTKENDKLWEIILLTCFNFPYGLVCGTMGLFILPAEAMRLYPNSSSVTLGISLLIVGFSQLVCPLAGRASDAYVANTALNKRKPFIILGAITVSVSVLGMWVASVMYFRIFYYICLLSAMVGLNVIYSVQSGLVPDLLGEETQGMSSGIVAVHSVSGSGIGFALMMATTNWDFHLVYPLYLFLLCVSTVSIIAAASQLESNLIRNTKLNAKDVRGRIPDLPARRASSHVDVSIIQTQQSGHQPMRIVSGTQSTGTYFGTSKLLNLSCRDIIDAYTIDTSKNFDFFWVFMGRTFYYIAVSVQAFILFFLRDVVGTTDEEIRQTQIASIALVAQTCAACIAYPVGRLSDNVKVGKKLLIYVACGSMSVVYICFLLSPLFGSWAFTFVLGSSVLYGLGNGCFLSVDYGLALETLPDKSKAAQALGIWGVSAFLGSAVGPLAWGALIEFFGGEATGSGFGGFLGVNKIGDSASEEKRYAYAGYEAMLLGGMAATAIAGLMIRFVKAENRGNEVEMVSVEIADDTTTCGTTDNCSFYQSSSVSERTDR